MIGGLNVRGVATLLATLAVVFLLVGIARADEPSEEPTCACESISRLPGESPNEHVQRLEIALRLARAVARVNTSMDRVSKRVRR